MDPERKLDRGIKALLGKGPADYSSENWRGLREQLRLLILHPGKFVAFRDHYAGQGDNRRLERREILHAAASLTAVQKHVASLSQEQQRGVFIDYVEKNKTRSKR